MPVLTQKPIVRPGDDRVCHDRLKQKPIVRPGDDRVCGSRPKLLNQYAENKQPREKTQIEIEISSAKKKI